MITGTIQETKRSQSGKSLGVKLNGKWYSTKIWELEHMTGTEITVTDDSTQEWNGKTIHWINEYTQLPTDQVPGVAHQRSATSATSATPVAASAAREHNRGRPDAADNYTENVLILRFIGHCFAGYPFQTTDTVQVRSRAKMLYELGQDILSGKITETETGPRRNREYGTQTGQPIRRQHAAHHAGPLIGDPTPPIADSDGPRQDEEHPTQEEYEDDIPF